MNDLLKHLHHLAFQSEDETLEKNQLDLKNVQIEILEKFYTAINYIPVEVLSKFPQFDAETFQKLKILHQRVKAKIKQTEKKLIDSKTNKLKENQKFDCSNNYTNDSTYFSTSTVKDDDSLINKNTEYERNTDVSLQSTFNYQNESESINKTSDDSMAQPSSLPSIPSQTTKKKSSFQLKVPTKAALLPGTSKRLEELIEKKKLLETTNSSKNLSTNCSESYNNDDNDSHKVSKNEQSTMDSFYQNIDSSIVESFPEDFNEDFVNSPIKISGNNQLYSHFSFVKKKKNLFLIIIVI